MPNQSQFHSTNASDWEFQIKGFEVTKELKTLGGEVVDIITTNGPGPAPVIGIIFPGRVYGHQIRNGAGKLHRWNYYGKSYDASTTVPRSLDLEKNVRRQFSWDYPFTTRSGAAVKILTRERIGRRTHVGLVGGGNSFSEKVVLYFPDGKTRTDGVETALDLINI